MHATQAAVCHALRRPAGLQTGEAQSSLAATMAKVVWTIRSVNVVWPLTRRFARFTLKCVSGRSPALPPQAFAVPRRADSRGETPSDPGEPFMRPATDRSRQRRFRRNRGRSVSPPPSRAKPRSPQSGSPTARSDARRRGARLRCPQTHAPRRCRTAEPGPRTNRLEFVRRRLQAPGGVRPRARQRCRVRTSASVTADTNNCRAGRSSIQARTSALGAASISSDTTFVSSNTIARRHFNRSGAVRASARVAATPARRRRVA